MKFPILRIVQREDVLLHEEMDEARRNRLIDRLTLDGVLKNPPIVARLNEPHRYLLLDGANRVSALDCLNAPHLLVQVENYDDPNLVLSHWNHVLRDLEAKTILGMIQSIPGIFLVQTRAPESSGKEDRHQLLSVVLDEGRTFQVFGGRDVIERVRFLQKISELYYHGEAWIDRVSHDELVVLKNHHPNFGALISYRDFAKDEIRTAAEKGCRLPSGLTRFLMPRRVLGFNFSVELLRSDLPLEDKQHRLEESIQKKVNEKQIRYYGEPTYIFDD